MKLTRYPPPVMVQPKEVVSIYVDPSCLAKAKCPRQWHYVVRRGLLMKNSKGPLAFGHAVHKYADLVVSGRPQMEALQHVQTAYAVDPAEIDKLLTLCMSWLPPKGILTLGDGRLAHELYIEHLMHEEIANDGKLYRVYACGTMDCLRLDSRGHLVLLDYKTTRWVSKERAFREHEDGVQFRFYAWWLYYFGHEVLPLQYSNLAREGKFYIILQLGMLNTKPPSWEWSRAFKYPLHQLEEFNHLMQETMRGLVEWYRADDPPKVGWINKACEGCDFLHFCTDEQYDGSDLMKVQFTTRPYRPSEFGKH